VVAAMVSWIPLALLSASEMMQILIPALATTAVTVAAMPWSRSFWTVFLYMNGEMVPRPPRTPKPRARRAAAFIPSRRPSTPKKSIGLVRPKGHPHH